MVGARGAKTTRAKPTSPIAAPGTKAQRCGLAVYRIESAPRRSQPIPNATRTDPVITDSVAPESGPTTNKTARRKPTTSEPATTSVRGRPELSADAGTRSAVCPLGHAERRAPWREVTSWFSNYAGASCGVAGGFSRRRRVRRRSWALMATTIVDRLIAMAPAAIGRSMPHGTRMPAAIGMATTL